MSEWSFFQYGECGEANTLEVLVVGNSFSTRAAAAVYEVMKTRGLKKLRVTSKSGELLHLLPGMEYVSHFHPNEIHFSVSIISAIST